MATIEASVRPELCAASDAVIEDAVGHADLMVLRGLLYQLTGDPELKAVALKSVRVGRVDTVAPATDADIALLRRKAVDFLKAYRDTGAGPIGYGPPERVPESMALVVGSDIPDVGLDLFVEEIALDPWARSPQWPATPDPKQLENFTVTIIGAGMGGLNAAVQLKRAGIRYNVIEKNAGVGGTWHENRYPGARVDTPSRMYTHLFGVEFPYPYVYGDHIENQKYFDWVADKFDLLGDITFKTEVRSLTWDEKAALWEIGVEGPDGHKTLRSNAVISGVGFLNRPNMPQIEGMDQFKGPSWHTARWPDGVDLRGKRVAVIGTGCTGYQMVPEIALIADHITVFQRTPQWLLPVPGYLSLSAPQILWLDRNLPYHANFMRFRASYGYGPDFAKIFNVDPDFDDPHACSEANKAARDRSIAFLESKLSDPELIATMTPNHPIMSARPVVVDPEYCILDAIQRDNVTLVTDGIKRINATGVEGTNGVQYDADVIIYATGFRANDFLFPMKITGRDGKTIDELWAADGARAYVGCMMPGFPNLWALYGPNTNGGLHVAAFAEMTMVYAMQCIETLILDGKKAIEPTEDAYWRYNRVVDARNAQKLWSDPRAHNYWRGEHGRSAAMNPFTGYEMRNYLLHPDFADLEIR